MVAWFKHDIPAWMDGTEDLDDGPYRAYHVICQLIYLNEGPIALNEHGIAGRCKQSIRTFRASLKVLLDLGKLTLLDGRLANSRAEKELENVSENRVNAAKGGHKSAEVRKSASKLLKNNSSDQASLPDSRSLKTREEETRPEETREEKKEPRASALVDDGWPSDFREQFWTRYPNKVGRPKALAKLEGCRKRGVPWGTLMDGLDRYIREKPPDRSWLNPETFLNQERWADQPATVAPQGTQNGRRTVQQAADDLLTKIRSFDDEPPSGIRGGTGEAPLRLLSSR